MVQGRLFYSGTQCVDCRDSDHKYILQNCRKMYGLLYVKLLRSDFRSLTALCNLLLFVLKKKRMTKKKTPKQYRYQGRV